jgi:hypothetical protein
MGFFVPQEIKHDSQWKVSTERASPKFKCSNTFILRELRRTGVCRGVAKYSLITYCRCSTGDMRGFRLSRIGFYLSAAALLLGVFPTASSTQGATGTFEVYCDSFGFFLANIEATPAPKEFFLFLYRGFPGFVDYLPEEEWLDVSVYPKGCSATTKCDEVARGKLLLDAVHKPDTTRISGKYDIDLNGRHLVGHFLAKRHQYKNPPRICM